MYQKQRVRAQHQAAELRKRSVREMAAATVTPLSVRVKRRAANNPDHVRGKPLLTWGVRNIFTGIEMMRPLCRLERTE